MTGARPRWASLAACVAACWAPFAAAAPLAPDDDPAGALAQRDPVGWLLAQAAPAGSVAPPAPATPELPAGSSWRSRVLPFLDSGEPVGFAPARWGGTIALEHLDQRAEGVNRRYSDAASVSLTAASYFWQPWFAQLRGNLTVLADADKSSGGADVGAGQGGATRGISLSGGGNVTVFPNSRFPFLASLDSTDSRATGSFAPSDFRSTRASLRQSWRDALGEDNATGTLDYSRLDSRTYGRDTVLALDTRYLRTAETWRGDAAFNWSRNRREAGEGTDILRLYGTHQYTPTPDLWVNSLASYTESDIAFASGGLDLRQRILQANTQAVWRPSWDERFVFTGGGRAFANGIDQSGAREDTYAATANAGFSFAPIEDASVQGSLVATHLSPEGGRRQLLTFESLGANYAPRPVDFGLLSWSPSVSLQASHDTGSEDGSRTLGTLQADQQLSRAIALGSAASLQLMLAQGAGLIDDSAIGRTTVLRYNGTAGLRVAATEGSDAYVSAGLGETRATGALEERFRLANVQLNGQLRFGAWDLLTANVTAQWVRASRVLTGTEESSRQVFGGFTYQHSRVFGLPRLRYLATATWNEGFSESRLLGNVDAPRENVTRLFDQRLLYDIGRLEIRLGMRIAKTDGRDDRQVYLRVARQFGQF